MAQDIIAKVQNKKPLSTQDQNFIKLVRENPNHEGFKDLWLAGLL
jgi:hypothetical protein